MPLKDHKEELRCARDIATLIKYVANEKQREEEELAAYLKEEFKAREILEATGLIKGGW